MWNQVLLFQLKSYRVESNLFKLFKKTIESDTRWSMFILKKISCTFFISRFCARANPVSHLQKWLTDGLIYLIKILADDTFIFSKEFQKKLSHRDLKCDLFTITESAFQWKMWFNTNANNQANDVYFLGNLMQRFIFLLS